jgi:alpha-tubulin suppressor-like RCC1 family protein
MKIFLFIISIFFLHGCGIKVDVGSSAIVQDGVQSPSLLTLVTPTSNVSFVDTPMVTVSGVTAGDTITVYSDNCLTAIGTQVAVATTVNITTNILPEGIYSLRANATRNGITSSCSTSTLSYRVDTTNPTISVTAPTPRSYTVSENLNFTVTASEVVNVSTTGGTPFINLFIGGVQKQATYLSGSGSRTLIFRYTIQALDNDSNGIVITSPLDFIPGSIEDLAENPLTPIFSVPNTTNVLVDNTAPTITSVTAPAPGTYTLNQNLDFYVYISEAVTVITTGGVPQMELNIGGVQKFATYLSGSGTDTDPLIFRYTIQAAEMDADGIVVSQPLQNSGTIRDAVGLNLLDLTFAVPNTATVLVDSTAIAPTVTGIVPPANDTYLTNPGENLEFTVNFSENVTVTGVPALTLELDGINRRAIYISGTTTNALLFRYTTVPSDSDTNGIALNSNWDFAFGSIRNGATVLLSTSIPAPSIPNLSGVLINQSPYILSVTIDPGTYTYNQNLDFTVVYSEIVTIDFIPVVVEGVGAGGGGGGGGGGGSILRFESVTADYLSGSGTTTLVYRWTNVGGLTDNDGITLISPILLNGVTLWDSVKNDAVLSFTVPDLSGVLVDGTPPTVPPVGVNYYGSTNFTFMPGAESVNYILYNPGTGPIRSPLAESAPLYPAIVSGDMPTSYASATIINNNIFDPTTGVFSVLTWAGFSSFFTNTSTVIRASNSAGYEDVTLSFTATPIINKGQISQGFQHTCAIASGGVFCWGKETALGGGVTLSDLNHMPFPVGSGIRLIAANKTKTCAVDASTHLQCWASLGMATPARYAFITSSDGEDVDQITDLSMSEGHICYLRLGKAYCFGSNTSGQLGNLTKTTSPIPQLVVGGHSFNKIVVGPAHTCALAGVKVYCWGRNLYGQLGNLTETDSDFPVWGGRLAHEIALGLDFTCALYKGDVFCFGANAKGELGRDTSVVTVPAMASKIDIPTYSGISKISINHAGSYVAALSYAGEIYGWGELSKVVLGSSSIIQQIGDISKLASDIVAGSSSVYYLKTDPLLGHTAAWYAFGHANTNGVIGVPGNVSGIQQDGLVKYFNPKASFTGLYSGNMATCVHVSSSPHCFGGVEDQTTMRRNYPSFLPLNTLFDETTTGQTELNSLLIIESAHGSTHSCYRFSGGKVICAGNDSNGYGVLGDGSVSVDASTGVSVNLAQSSKKLCASQDYTCSLDVLGNVECWGSNRSGRLNTPTMTLPDGSFPLPQTIINSQDVVDIACLQSRVCFLKEDRKVYCTAGGALNEVLVPTAKEFVKIKAGSGQFACAQSSDHELFCFGDNNRNTQQGQRLTPDFDLDGTKVIGGVGFPVTGRVLEYGVGARHACATMLVVDGARITEDLYCWGDDTQGQVRGSAGDSANQPVKKSSATSSTTEIVAGDGHTCILDRGSISCWGDAAAQGQDQINAVNGSKNPILPLVYR